MLGNTLGENSLDWFDVIGAGDIVAHKKPAADIYHHVLQHLGLDAGECIAFEDSHNGLCAAKGAGIATIITYNGYTEHDDFTAAELVLDQLGDADNPSRNLQRLLQQDFLSVDSIRQLAQQR